jgi:hypothetical protein
MRVALVGVLLVTGCTPAFEYEPEPEPTRSRVPSASVTAMRGDLLAALQRLNGAPYRFTVAGNAPEGGTFAASGTVDPAGQRYESTIDVTGARPISAKRIVVGTNCYLWQADIKAWVRLDMSRVRPDSTHYFNPADPAGLVPFIAGIMNTMTVRATADGWTLQLHQEKVTDLPLGAPTYRRWGTRNLPFTVKADPQGLVTTIGTNVELTSGPDVVFTTTFTGHGVPVQINPPAPRDVREAADFYYT